MKKLLLVIFLLNIQYFAFSQSNEKELTEIDKKKILLINHLCVIKTSLTHGINSDNSYEVQNVFLIMCSDYIQYAKNVFNENLKSIVNPNITSDFNSIIESYEKMIELANSGNEEAAFRIAFGKKLTDIKIEKIIKEILCN